MDLLQPHTMNEAEQRSRRNATLVWTIGRLKPGITVPQAVAALQPRFDDATKSVPPAFRKEVKLRVRPLRERQVLDARLASWILLGSVIAVLLIACANVANLLLARAASRQREFAVRAALGAGRGRLVRQALTESTLLALAGGAAGCAMAVALLRLFTAIAPEGIPRLQQASVDGRVLLFTVGLCAFSGVLSGLVPSLESPRPEMLAGWRSVGLRQAVFRNALVAAQMGISVVLLAGASLLLRSLWNLQDQPLGIHADHLITATVTLERGSYAEPSRRAAFFDELEQRLARPPGVSQVALTDSLPPEGSAAGPMLYAVIDVEGRPPVTNGTGGAVAWRMITPGYFRLLGIPILRGRAFTDDDRAPDRHAVILSDLLARRMFPGQDPLGKHIRPGRMGAWLTVVGVAANVRNNGLAGSEDPEYYAIRDHSGAGVRLTATAIVRSPLHASAIAGLVRTRLARLDPTLPATIETFEQRIGRFTE
jgi:putative ABC transport system permease protein